MGVTVPEAERYEEPYLQKNRETHDYYIWLAKKISSKFNFLADPQIKVSDELKDAISFMSWKVSAFDIVILSRFALISSFVIILGINSIAMLFGYSSLIILMLSMIIPFVLAHLVTDYPKSEASLEKIDSLGNAPAILTQIVIYLKQNPNLEKAIEFVTTHSEGKIVEDFKSALWKCMIGSKTKLKEEIGKIAETWGKQLTEFKRRL